MGKNITLPHFEKSEIKTLISSYMTDDVSHEFTNDVNSHLKDGWTILSSACGACVFFHSNIVIQRYAYTVILYKEFYTEPIYK